MAEDDPFSDPMPDPHSPEWTVAWTAKRVLRTHLGPRVKRFLPVILAEEIIKALRGSKWRIIKEPPNAAHSGPTAHNEGVLENWREQRQQWELENGIEPSTAPDAQSPE